MNLLRRCRKCKGVMAPKTNDAVLFGSPLLGYFLLLPLSSFLLPCSTLVLFVPPSAALSHLLAERSTVIHAFQRRPHNRCGAADHIVACRPCYPAGSSSQTSFAHEYVLGLGNAAQFKHVDVIVVLSASHTLTLAVVMVVAAATADEQEAQQQLQQPACDVEQVQG